ncbi:MAG TPA: hypothetical protein VK843_06880 [Planctomycetota bacterium]|nr:hypothetical protein [Planctomycetota bacterium]
MMEAAQIEIRAFVGELLARKGEGAALADGERLITSGRLDSIDVLEIVAFLETRYAVDFAARPFDPGDFDTVESIAKLVPS